MKLFLFVIATMLASVFLSVVAVSQTQERTIKLVKWRNEPLEIIKLEVNGKEFTFNQSFNAEVND